MIDLLTGDRTVVRLTTDDASLLLPALAQCGASFWLTGGRHLDVRGVSAADLAQLAAAHNARVADLETVRPGTPDRMHVAVGEVR